MKLKISSQKYQDVCERKEKKYIKMEKKGNKEEVEEEKEEEEKEKNGAQR